MRVQRLHISAFGSLHQRAIDFGEGLTVLLGPNEAGKSTVLHCLAQMFFGKPSQRSLFPDMTPWEVGEFAAELTVSHEGDRYRLVRHFAEAGPRAVSLLHLRDDGSERLITREAGEVRRWTGDWLGTGDDRVFYRVFCLTQADLTPLDNYGGLREHLERVAGGAEVAVTAAIGRVESRLAAVRRGMGQPALPQNWGLLKRAGEALGTWETRLLDAKRQQKRLAEVRERMQALQAQLEAGTARLAELDRVLAQERQRSEFTARLADLRAEWDRLDASRQQFAQLARDREQLQQRLAALPAAYADADTARRRLTAVQPGGMPAAGWSLLAVAALMLGARLFAPPSLHWVAALAILLGVLGGVVVMRQLRRKAAQTRLCREFGVTSIAEGLQRLETSTADRRAVSVLDAACATVSSDAAGDERRRVLAREIAVLDEKLAQFRGLPLDAVEGLRLDSEQATLRASLPAWQEEERGLLRELAVLEESERDLIDLEDGVAYWREQEAHAQDEAAALELALALLHDAGADAHEALAGPLAVKISPLFAAMTAGRYPAVRVSDDAKSFTVHPLDAAGMPIPPEQLSRGTGDQFLLAVRLALGQVIAGPSRTPLFLLDDPLLHFDSDRRREALAALTGLAGRAQIVLATHDESVLVGLHDVTVVRM